VMVGPEVGDGEGEFFHTVLLVTAAAWLRLLIERTPRGRMGCSPYATVQKSDGLDNRLYHCVTSGWLEQEKVCQRLTWNNRPNGGGDTIGVIEQATPARSA
jgi:hypothetical protein